MSFRLLADVIGLVDDRITPTDKLILIVLADCHNGETGQCNPSIGYICEKTGLSKRTVTYSIARMTKSGFILRSDCHADNGRQRSNHYQILISEGATDAGGRVQEMHGEGAADAPLEPVTRTRKNEPEEDSSDSFDEFWKDYPKRVGSNPKQPARSAFQRAVREVPPETIIAAAFNYALRCAEDGTDPKFIPMAVTWLNQRRWEDDQGGGIVTPDDLAATAGEL